MTVKEYRENTSLAEQKVFAEKLHCWLERYTHEVYERVMGQMESIINDEFTLKLIDELYNRTMKERRDEISQIMFSLSHDDEYKYNLHNNSLEHSESYRDILYDMYIMQIK